MTNDDDLQLQPQPSDPLYQLAVALVECGAVLSQMINSMMAHRQAHEHEDIPDLVPIPEIAYNLVHSALTDIRNRHSARDFKLSARIANEATAAICENIFIVPDDGGLDPLFN